MKNIIKMALLCLSLGLLSCEKPEAADNGYQAPEAPAAVNQNNLINLEFYSRLNEETLFQTTDYQTVISHLSANTAPMAFLFDRSDAVMGQASPVVNIALHSKLKSFFIQNQVGETQIEGTGMIVRPLVPVFNGMAIADSLFLSGCKMTAPLSQPVIVTLMTCKLTHAFQFPVLARALGDGLLTNKVVVGTIRSELEEEMEEYLRYHLKDFRLSFFASPRAGTTFKLFYLTPVGFVSRSTTELTVGQMYMYQCKIEYLN